jgi:hypothetical protein
MRVVISLVVGLVLSVTCYVLAFYFEPSSGRVGFFQLFETVLSWPVSKVLGGFKVDKMWPLAVGLITIGTILFGAITYLCTLLIGLFRR